MSQPTNVGLRSWIGYRGGSGYLLWLLHRVLPYTIFNCTEACPRAIKITKAIGAR